MVTHILESYQTLGTTSSDAMSQRRLGAGWGGIEKVNERKGVDAKRRRKGGRE
jgi:hypothetical protein